MLQVQPKRTHRQSVLLQPVHCQTELVTGTNSEDSDGDDIEVLTSTTSMGSYIYKTIAYKTGQHLDFIVDTGIPITFMPILQLERAGFT